MAALKNSRQEAFARCVVEGKTQVDAYVAAGYKPGPAVRAHASRLAANGSVSARIEELKAEAAKAAVMSGREVLEELSKLGRSNMQDFVVEGDDISDVVLALQRMPREHAAAIQELIVETYVEGGGKNSRTVKRVKLKLHDKRGPLNDLGRYHELFSGPSDDLPDRPPGGRAQLSDLELARRIAFALEVAAGLGSTSAAPVLAGTRDDDEPAQ